MFDFTRVVPLARAVVKNSKPQKTTKQKLGIEIFVFIGQYSNLIFLLNN